MPSESGRSAVIPPDRDLQAALPFAETCFRGVARRMRARLVNRTGVDTPVSASGVYAQPAGAILDNPELADAMWCPFRIERGDLRGFAVVQGQLLARLIDRLFGGGAEVSPYQPRPVTEVEIKIGARLCREVFEAIEEYWPAGTRPRIHVETAAAGASHHVLGEFPPTAPMVVCDLTYGRTDHTLGRLLVALPNSILRDLSQRRPASTTAPAPARAMKMDRLMPVSVDLTVEIARVSLTYNQLEGLQIGDEIPIGPISEAKALANGEPAFIGEAGTKGSVRSFRVTKKLLDLRK